MCHLKAVFSKHADVHFPNTKLTRPPQISSVDKKESECLTFGENTFLLCALISLLASLST